MKSTAIILAIIKPLITNLVSAESCLSSKPSQYGYHLQHPAYQKLINQNLATCHTKCIVDRNCSSINFNLNNGDCELSHVTKKDYGSSPVHSFTSCKRIHELYPKALSGIYWIHLGLRTIQKTPFQVFCEMETDGGGWTLVYSYRFLNFANFQHSSNAVSPLPNWPGNPAYMTSGISTTVPLSETTYASMNFTLWKEIGSEFLVKPNITHWFSCVPRTGDLVNWKVGSISYKVVMNVAKVCLNKAPTQIKIAKCGLALYAPSDHYIYFEGSKTSCWPVHDPCGIRSISNHLTNVSPPGGAVYIR